MKTVEIPLLRESSAFAVRLMDAARRFGDGRYHFHRRVNWSHRFSEDFYDREAECFLRSSADYLAGATAQLAELPDVYAQRLRLRETLNVVVKVLAHWAFALLGHGASRRIRLAAVRTYRKCYVDDIELVFDPSESSVMRVVYPFPLNLRRQLRYLASLRRKGFEFEFAGNAYLPADLLRFLLRRDVRSMMRLESRAQMLHAAQIAGLGIETFQLSDEFNLGSLDFARRLARYPVRVINSAHGVGKYLPVHAYPVFHVLTRRQQEYYHAVHQCTYPLRSLNDVAAPLRSEHSAAGAVCTRLVFLSQTFPGLTGIVQDNETVLVTRLQAEFGDRPDITLHYKPHPTSNLRKAPPGFEVLTDLNQVNGRTGTMFVSFFSTCQIDPTFKGRKVLVRGHLIHPEISFDASEEIVNLDELVTMVHAGLRRGKGAQATAFATSLEMPDA